MLESGVHVARIPGSPPVGDSSNRPVCLLGDREQGGRARVLIKVLPESCCSLHKPSDCWPLSGGLVSISLPYCTHSWESLSRTIHCRITYLNICCEKSHCCRTVYHAVCVGTCEGRLVILLN